MSNFKPGTFEIHVCFFVKSESPNKELTDAAATAESLQPRGYTLETTQVLYVVWSHFGKWNRKFKQTAGKNKVFVLKGNEEIMSMFRKKMNYHSGMFR